MASGSVNKVILIGNLGVDPELRRTPNGAAVTNFTMATTRRFKTQDGQMREDTEWHNIVAWNKAAEIMSQYLRKGSKVYIEGSLQTRSWESDGIRKYRTEIVVREFNFLDSRNDNTSGQNQQSGGSFGGAQSYTQAPQDFGSGYSQQPQQSAPASQPSDMPIDDDLPF
ncbi:single-stranded DNA-binding protein [Chitinivibrio alkaliphilus]|uniref:Single-stranded DNA-binding protein n=1 Tax=Chitinivibrio alkaliphilus ACht1 TaxID=1313304 RepID=U7D892_9BACT|nr:single-stranded DNA-binding protein [Chitinivibrio alkaliphilus]ERP39175.1 single-strand binding protein [Chitinivibrio alkaliphilus ACht1]